MKCGDDSVNRKSYLPALQSKKNAAIIKSCLIQMRDNTQRLIGQKVSDAKKKLHRSDIDAAKTDLRKML